MTGPATDRLEQGTRPVRSLPCGCRHTLCPQHAQTLPRHERARVRRAARDDAPPTTDTTKEPTT